jgi:hypothetical protein
MQLDSPMHCVIGFFGNAPSTSYPQELVLDCGEQVLALSEVAIDRRSPDPCEFGHARERGGLDAFIGDQP